MGIIGQDPPHKIDRAFGVSWVVLGVLMTIAGLYSLVSIIAHPSPAEFFVLAGVTTFVFLVGGPIFLWLGMRKLNRKKDYQNSPVDFIL